MSKIVNPFREDSAIAEVFKMAAEGTTRAALERYAVKHGKNVHRIFHVLRTGAYGTSKWKYTQTDDGAVKLVAVVSGRKGPNRASSNKQQRTRRAA